MGRPPKENKQQRFTVALPPEVRSQLEEAAATIGHSIGEEIRRRIGLSLDVEAYDKPTRDLAATVMWIAEDVARQSGENWHANRKANEALAAALQEYLELLKPPFSGGVSDLFGPDDPATLGRVIARNYFRGRAEIEGSIEQAAQKRQPKGSWIRRTHRKENDHE